MFTTLVCTSVASGLTGIGTLVSAGLVAKGRDAPPKVSVSAGSTGVSVFWRDTF